MDEETRRLRALAAATAKRLTAKKQVKDNQELPAKRPRFTFSDEPNEPPGLPVLPLPSEKVEAQGDVNQRKDRWQPTFHAAARAAEAAAIAGEGGSESYTLVEVPDEFTGLLIGKHGSGIKALQEQTGAMLCVGKLSVQGKRKVCVTGSFESQEAAQLALMSFVERQQEIKKQKSVQKTVVEHIEVPNKFAGRLIGHGGEVIKQVQDAYGVRADMDKCIDQQTRRIEIQGSPEAVQYAKQHIELLLLELYRRFKIYNAPLESKYQGTSANLFTSSLQQTQCPMELQQEMDQMLHPWAAYYAGNLDCVLIFEKLKNLEDAEIPPGVDP